MSYLVKEIFYTIQGEGFHTGRPAVFCRFSGCNLWSGREKDRSRAICQFCDTDFLGTDGHNGGHYRSAKALATAIARLWPEQYFQKDLPFVVFTGGEPLLQLDDALIRAVRRQGFQIAVETNGTLPAPEGIQWLTVSPKAGAPLVQRTGDELKLVFPQEGLQPQELESLRFFHFYLQPMDGPNLQENIQLAVEYCLNHPNWKLSLQTQKFIGIP